MTPGVDYCLADDEVQRAREIMESKQVRRLPVLDKDHRLVGTVAMADLAAIVDPSESGKTIRKISQPTGSRRINPGGAAT